MSTKDEGLTVSPNDSKPLVSGSLLIMKPMKGCGVCGSKMVWIRGKYPKTPKRKICPTCAWERLEQINEISQPNYGQAYKSNDH